MLLCILTCSLWHFNAQSPLNWIALELCPYWCIIAVVGFHWQSPQPIAFIVVQSTCSYAAVMVPRRLPEHRHVARPSFLPALVKDLGMSSLEFVHPMSPFMSTSVSPFRHIVLLPWLWNVSAFAIPHYFEPHFLSSFSKTPQLASPNMPIWHIAYDCATFIVHYILCNVQCVFGTRNH